MGQMFDDAEIEIDCPQCGHKMKSKLGSLRSNNNLTCLGCRSTITVETKQFDRDVRGIEDSFKRLFS